MQLVILKKAFCNLEKYRLMMVVMPYPSNPCEDSQAKRGQAISCYFNFNLLYQIQRNIVKTNMLSNLDKYFW